MKEMFNNISTYMYFGTFCIHHPILGIPGAIFVHNGGFVAYTVDREAAIKFIDAAMAEDMKRKEEMSEKLKQQEIHDVVKNLRRMSIRAYK